MDAHISLNDTKQALVLIGPPGGGKGTVSAALKENGFDHISTGDMLRDAQERGTELGLKAKAIMQAGGLVGDSIVIAMVEERIAASNAARFIFDGFPRTKAQAEALDQLLEKLGFAKNEIHVVRLDVSDDNLFARLEKRRNEAIIHGGQPRSDDTLDVFKKRLTAYKGYVKELEGYYRHRIHAVDGNSIPAVTLAQVKRFIGLMPRPASTEAIPNYKVFVL